MSRREKERTKIFNFLEICEDIYLDIVVTYLLAHIAWETYIKWTQSNDTNTFFLFYFYVPARHILPFLQELTREEGYTVEYTPSPEGVPEGEA